MGFIGDLTSKVKSAATGLVDRVEKKVSEEVAEVKKEVRVVVNAADTFVKEEVATVKESVDTAKHLWSSPNKGAAVSAQYEVEKVKLTSKGGTGRISPEIQSALIEGVADRRTDSDRGERGVLGKDQAVRAAKTLVDMDAGSYAQTKRLLDQAGQGADGKLAAGADPKAERALILKAVAARQDRLADPAKAEGAMKEVEAFAKDIRGLKRAELMTTSTVTDIDGAKSDDGLRQSMENTCAPTVGQMTHAETDPAYARQLNKEGLSAPEGSEIDKEQQQVFRNTAGQTGTPVGRQGAQGAELMNLLKANLDSQTKGGIPPPVTIPPGEISALLKYTQGKQLTKADQALLQPAKDKVQQLRPDLDGAAIDKLHAAAQAQGANEESALKLTGNNLNEHPIAAGQSDQGLKAIRERLQAGNPVPISIAYEGKDVGHALLMTDYRDGKYLVSDPYSGKTAWVPEAKLKDGSFSNDEKYFSLGGNSRLDNYYAP